MISASMLNKTVHAIELPRDNDVFYSCDLRPGSRLTRYKSAVIQLTSDVCNNAPEPCRSHELSQCSTEKVFVASSSEDGSDVASKHDSKFFDMVPKLEAELDSVSAILHHTQSQLHCLLQRMRGSLIVDIAETKFLPDDGWCQRCITMTNQSLSVFSMPYDEEPLLSVSVTASTQVRLSVKKGELRLHQSPSNVVLIVMLTRLNIIKYLSVFKSLGVDVSIVDIPKDDSRVPPHAFRISSRE